MVPSFAHAMLDDVQQALEVRYPANSSRYFGIDSNGDLVVSAVCPPELIHLAIQAPPELGYPNPPPISSLFEQ